MAAAGSPGAAPDHEAHPVRLGTPPQLPGDGAPVPHAVQDDPGRDGCSDHARELTKGQWEGEDHGRGRGRRDRQYSVCRWLEG